jgi:CHASE3 domain sensor protein
MDSNVHSETFQGTLNPQISKIERITFFDEIQMNEFITGQKPLKLQKRTELANGLRILEANEKKFKISNIEATLNKINDRLTYIETKQHVAQKNTCNKSDSSVKQLINYILFLLVIANILMLCLQFDFFH